jgi:hypothetical protein
MQSLDIEAELVKKASREFDLDEVTAKPVVRALLQKQLGEDYLIILQQKLHDFGDMMLIGLNEHLSSEAGVLDWWAAKMAALSLTEDPHSATMWAYYAAEGRGFVIAFRTSDDFFRAKNGKSGYRLHKVTYFDGLLDEVFDDPYAAMISKTSDWRHEREWRLYNDPGDADQVLSLNGQYIHLFDLPASAVEGVIVGYRSAEATIERLREALNQRVPHATLRGVQPDRSAGRFTETPL